MALTDGEIFELISSGVNLIEPFDEKKLQGASYDVAIGQEVNEISAFSNVIDLTNQDVLDLMYVSHDIGKGYILKPGQYVLIQLNETISLPDNMIARIVPRTRFTRLGVLVADQFCNPSYSGRLSIGVRNASPNNIMLTAGLSIAQIVFERLDVVPTESRLYRNKADSAYHDESCFIGARFDDGELSDSAKSIYQKMVADLIGE